MKIAFWSNCEGKSGVTSNMVCMATLFSVVGAGKIVMLENHYSNRNVASMLLSYRQIENLKESGQFGKHYSMEQILKGLYTGARGDVLIHQTAVPMLYPNIYYIPQSCTVNREVFNYEFNHVYRKLFDELEKFADFVFIDTERNQNLSTNTILTEADLVVVNLIQNPLKIMEFFENYSSIREKSVYLIGEYQREIPISIRKICYEYHIPRNKIGVIPYNMEFSEAMAEGRGVQFINRNFEKASSRENEYFIKQCKKSIEMLKKNFAEVKRKKKEMFNKYISEIINRSPNEISLENELEEGI